MKKNNISEIIGIIVSLCGLIVMIGWLLDIAVLKSVLPVWVSMKFSTALSFFLCGIELYFIAQFQKNHRELSVIILPILGMTILLLMTCMLTSTIIGVNAGVEEMFAKDSILAIGSVTPGRPAIATMINFIFIAMSGFFTAINIKVLNKLLLIFGATISVIGLTALLGYITNQPSLYFRIIGKSSAMAIHTAILFALWGIGLFLAKGNK